MSAWESSLYGYLKSVAGVTAVFGSGDNTRIYFGAGPSQAVTPYAIVSQVSANPSHSFLGSERIVELTVQIDVYATAPALARTAAEALREALDGKANRGSAPVLRSILKDGERTVISAAGDGSQDHIYGISTDYRIAYIVSTTSL
jgi:hypothetical protein